MKNSAQLETAKKMLTALTNSSDKYNVDLSKDALELCKLNALVSIAESLEILSNCTSNGVLIVSPTA